jgi:ElaB/YqjD/DUF883 family membrane-anchored ribosome-binding protein
MDQEPDLSRRRPEEIRRQIDATRSDLTTKLEALEQQVKGGFSNAKDAVTDTVEAVKHSVDDTVQTVKETVHETVDSLKRSLDITQYVERYPWAMLGGSVLAGYVLGRLVEVHAPPSPPPPALSPVNERTNGRRWRDTFSARTTSSLIGELTHKFAPEIEQLKSLAIGALMSLPREMVKQSAPSHLAEELEHVIDNVTAKLGGKVMAEPFQMTGSRTTPSSN